MHCPLNICDRQGHLMKEIQRGNAKGGGGFHHLMYLQFEDSI